MARRWRSVPEGDDQEVTFFCWKKVYGGLMPAEVSKLKQLQKENMQLWKLVADLTLDKEMLTEIVTKSCTAGTSPRDDRLCSHLLSRIGEARLPRRSGATIALISPASGGKLNSR